MAKGKHGKLRAFGEVYNVQERMTDAGIHGSWDDYPDWYEYDMFLLDSDGDIVDSWDSLVETYNGVQRLSKETAESAVKEIVDDVAAGKVEHWFSNVPKELLSTSTKRATKSKTRKHSQGKQLSLKGLRR